ncbi:methyl-accepting chemotaxis protein [Sinorhizobium meliloti]|uniref:methyl-accepting chemotaxis protein n=1 Tax=Rhizobium meliloti TaxID=382 RepID=UPI00299EB68E|nr:methyl-accepting chemotaxis protein [Sinorhizobium meliloti]MDW9663835.1 methyl-accepting chemotaxis protein [Sinorhizobium meliloti]MDX0053602.1 methyl-accepting chemotaxis protein [Sinorhizobium meliloti]
MTSTGIRTFVRDYGPICLFVSMTIFGAAVIWVGKLYDVDISVVTTIPIVLMLIYLTLNMLPGLRVRSEQAGDNLYYMGFIFTLASLGISLYKFTGEASIDDVVRNFGIAIVSTITGIALRIFYNQMRRDPADIETAVRIELAEMTRRVRTELDTSALEFSSYRRTSNQMLSEGFEEIARQAQRNGELVRASIEAMSMKATQTLQETSEKLIATLDKAHGHLAELAVKNVSTVAQVAEQMDRSVGEVVRRADALSGTMDSLTAKFAAAKSPDEVLRVDVAPAVEALKALVESNVKSIEANSAAARDAAKKVITAIAPFKQVAAQLNSLSGDIKGCTAAVGSSSEALNKAAEQIQETVQVMRSTLEAERKTADRVKELAGFVNTLELRSTERDERNAIQTARIEKALAKSEAIVTAASAPATETEKDLSDDRSTMPPAAGEDAITVPEIATAAIEAAEAQPDKSRWSIWNR